MRTLLSVGSVFLFAAVVAAQPGGGFAPAPDLPALTKPAAPGLPPTIRDIGGGVFPGDIPPVPEKVWSGGGEIGLNGADGNSELFNIRAGFNAQRKTRDNLFASDFLYTYARQSGNLTQNQALINARDEILFPETSWSVFGSTNIEYDELRAYRFRVGVYGGVGYQVVDEERIYWRVRAGAGAVREFAAEGSGLADRWVPELLFGTDFNYKIDDRSSFVSTLDYYPRVDDFGQFRVRSRLAYQFIVDPTLGIVFRAGIQNRYDSSPGNARRNDLSYFTTLGFSF